ncbi:MAG: hypothetical protein HHJ09_10660 [Glaciimonas sp.]|nr:hypothetical protein [Glaciimonas sp.]
MQIWRLRATCSSPNFVVAQVNSRIALTGVAVTLSLDLFTLSSRPLRGFNAEDKSGNRNHNQQCWND